MLERVRAGCFTWIIFLMYGCVSGLWLYPTVSCPVGVRWMFAVFPGQTNLLFVKNRMIYIVYMGGPEGAQGV